MSSLASPQATREVQAWIERHDGPSGVVFTAHARAERAFEGDYTLLIEKTGAGGTSRSRQAGAVVLSAGRPATLSRSGIGRLSPGDAWTAVLEVRDRGVVVARDRLASP